MVFLAASIPQVPAALVWVEARSKGVDVTGFVSMTAFSPELGSAAQQVRYVSSSVSSYATQVHALWACFVLPSVKVVWPSSRSRPSISGAWRPRLMLGEDPT